MREIIVASQSPQAAEHVRSILQSDHIFTEKIYRSGAEVLMFASIRPDAVVICGRLPDMSAQALAELLPNGFDVIWLMPSDAPEPVYISNLVTLHLPLNRMEFLNTVRTLSANGAEISPAPRRTAQEEELLNAAKVILQTRYQLSEQEAHTFLQKRSMESGQRLLETASQIVEFDI